MCWSFIFFSDSYGKTLRSGGCGKTFQFVGHDLTRQCTNMHFWTDNFSNVRRCINKPFRNASNEFYWLLKRIGISCNSSLCNIFVKRKRNLFLHGEVQIQWVIRNDSLKYHASHTDVERLKITWTLKEISWILNLFLAFC